MIKLSNFHILKMKVCQIQFFSCIVKNVMLNWSNVKFITMHTPIFNKVEHGVLMG
jgi:hypothetical protein